MEAMPYRGLRFPSISVDIHGVTNRDIGLAIIQGQPPSSISTGTHYHTTYESIFSVSLQVPHIGLKPLFKPFFFTGFLKS